MFTDPLRTITLNGVA